MEPTVHILRLVFLVSSFKCYVCAPDKGKPEDIYTLKKSFPDHSVQYCSTYTADSINKFLLECPSGGSGCLTKFEGIFLYKYLYILWGQLVRHAGALLVQNLQYIPHLTGSQALSSFYFVSNLTDRPKLDLAGVRSLSLQNKFTQKKVYKMGH